jgi:tetratricopeptide (TPR) repeat protein
MKRTAPSPAARQQWVERVDAAMRVQDFNAAGRLSLEAHAAGVEHPSLLNIAAAVRFGEQRLEEAAQLLRRARALAPRDANILNSLGACLNALGRSEGALEAYNAAVRIDPDLAATHFNRGALLEELNDIKGARSAYERAVSLDGSDVESIASLAWLDAQAGDAASARSNGERALKLSPSNLLARIAVASSDLQQGDLAAASGRLSELGGIADLTPDNRSIVMGVLGDLKDAEGRPAEAFAVYSAANAEMKAMNRNRFEAPGMETALDHVRRLTNWFAAVDPSLWREAPPQRPRAADPQTHVFLVGFPRSGTTLLENVLAAHPAVVSLEEKDNLAAASAAYLTSADGLERLAKISAGEAMRQRESYWSAVRGSGVEPRGRVFVDKMPLGSTTLPLVAKLFPTARVLFARRDPRDVALSCFRRRFAMNPAMYELLTLEGAATFYDAVMRLSELYRERLPVPQLEIRYESLVDDFEGTARAACDFLGFEWDAQMKDFAARAGTRGISTPSAAQVARGLNREGRGVWKRYREQMAPIIPILKPWVERFGYDGE